MILLEQAGKQYRPLIGRRSVTALSDFTLEMARGEVVGIAGPNGAGKSTLISLLLGFLNPTSGAVRIEGLAPRAYVERVGIGYLPELVNLPPRWKVPDALRRMAALAGIPRGTIEQRVESVIAELGLGEHAGKRIKELSKGNLQRVGLGQTLLSDADVIILDEPTHGLDPLWTQRFRDVVLALRRPDRLILIASHNLDELERLADRVAILDHGRLQRVVAQGAESGDNTTLSWRIVFEGTPDVGACFANAAPIDARPGRWLVQASRRELSGALAILLANGAILVECVPEQSRLESAFNEAVQR